MTGMLKHMITMKSQDAQFEMHAQPILLHMRLYNVFNGFLWQLKAMSIMLVGVGVKLALYKPEAAADEYFSLEQRINLALPLVLCFSVQLTHSIFVKNRHHYTCTNARRFPVHMSVVSGRVLLLMISAGLAAVELTPVVFLCIQALLSLMQCVLLHVQDFKAIIKSPIPHPMAAMPDALQSLQGRRKRAKDAARARQSGIFTDFNSALEC